MRPCLRKAAVDHPHVGDHAAVLVELGVEDQGAGRGRRLALGRRHAGDDRLQHLDHPLPGLGRDRDRVARIAAEQVGDFRRDPLRLGARQVDLVHHRDQLQPVLDRQVGVGDGLRLDPLGGVDDEQGALAGGEAARDLVGEVDVAGRVDQVQVVGLTVGGLVLDPHRLRLDRDPALALEVHRVEHLGLHFLRVDGAGDLEDAVGQGRLAVVYVGDYREVADVVHAGAEYGRLASRVLGYQPAGPVTVALPHMLRRRCAAGPFAAGDPPPPAVAKASSGAVCPYRATRGRRASVNLREALRHCRHADGSSGRLSLKTIVGGLLQDHLAPGASVQRAGAGMGACWVLCGLGWLLRSRSCRR